MNNNHWSKTEKRKEVIQKISVGWKNLEKCPYKKNGSYFNCLVCDKQFYRKPSFINQGKTKYCSRSCCGVAKKNIPENKHSRWQSKNPSYRAVHAWMHKHYKKKGICKHCNKKEKTQWANISQKYKRNRNDFMELCPSCHKKYDMLNIQI